MWNANEVTNEFTGGLLPGLASTSTAGSSRARKQYANLTKWFCVLQLLCGVGVATSSLVYLYGFTSATGILIGGLLVVVGVIGLAGASSNERRLLHLYLLGVLLAMMLSFQFMSQVERSAVTDCTLAQLGSKIHVMEMTLQKLATKERTTEVMSRLEEVEDILDIIADDKKKAVHPADHMRIASDRAYILEKLRMLREHAEHILNESIDVVDLDIQHAENKTGEPRVGEGFLTAEEHEMLENRINTMTQIIDLITMHVDDGQDIGIEEYEMIVNSITSMWVPPHKPGEQRPLTQDVLAAKEELANAHGAFERISSAHEAGLDEHTTARKEAILASIRQRKEEKEQEYWTREFEDDLQHHELDDLAIAQDMPEHCLQESSAWKAMLGIGTAVVILQLMAAYCVLTLMFMIPIKTD